MSAKDPREAVLREILHGWDPLEPPPTPYEVRDSLAALDAADPLRQEVARLREALTKAMDLIDEGLPTSARRFMRDALAGGEG